jgi:hypothetical protein
VAPEDKLPPDDDDALPFTTEEEIPPEDLGHAAPLNPSKRPPRRQRGPYGTRLSKMDRELFLQCLRAGGTLTAAAKFIGRSRTTVERWRSFGREGRPGYARLYYDTERAMGHCLMRLEAFAVKKATEATADGRLALALADRLDPQLIALRQSGRQNTAVQVVASASSSGEETKSTAAAQVITYRLSWDDGEPMDIPGITSKPAAIEARSEPFIPTAPGGGNGHGNGDGPPDEEPLRDDDADDELS